VCCDPRLNLITTDIAAGMSQHQVATKYSFTQPVVWKHVHEHMGAALIEHNLKQPVLDQIRMLNQRTLRILGEAEHGKWKNPAIALQAIRECRNNGELIAKLTGELKSGPVNEPVKVEIVYINKAPMVTEHDSDHDVIEHNAAPAAIEAGSGASLFPKGS
jgi:hypothetical protein